MSNRSHGRTRIVTKEDLQQLKLLERVLKESLPSGTILHPDSDIVISIYGIGRDPKEWGPDADCFEPDRFLPGRKTGLFIPFSCGPRNCLGYQLAFMSAKMALISILRRYKITGKIETSPAPQMEHTTYDES
ncbi:unnamed protein product [Leptosia nina]|uniref:Cytochrome P450 n=1 Tax=Leptosia nina TaxID=320188 RepID=A0AAV1JP37_9NEOP